MTLINIRRVRERQVVVFGHCTNLDFQDEKDPFYRYKMEPLLSKIEGKGNGIKTVIVNLSSVAQSLSRPPACMVTLTSSVSFL